MNWATIQKAIQDWIVVGSSLADDHVIWSQQGGDRPTGTWIELTASIRQVGHDALNTEDNPTPSAGAEILHIVRGVRELTLTLQCFGGGAVGNASSVATLHKVIGAVTLPSVGDALDMAGVGVGEFADVQPIGGVLGKVELEPRAKTSVRLWLAEEISETGTHIEFAELEDVRDGDPGVSTYIPSDPT